MSFALSITVDVDGEAGLPHGGRDHGDRLTSRSERVYGIARGLPRLVALLADFDARATFYVPGITALRHAEAIVALVAAGHEIGHHGHRHLVTPELTETEERSEVRDGLEALVAVIGTRPLGYRSPGWELTPVTRQALHDHGFAWDSSLMGDDRPYWMDGLLELPVHWALDDAPYFDHAVDPAGLERAWRSELWHAACEDRPLTCTLHPEILGRAHRLDVLRSLLDYASELRAPVRTHGELHRAECAARR